MNSHLRTLIASLLPVVAAGCSRPPAITGEPDLTMNPSGRTPLAGLLTFTTDQPARATLTISDGEHASTVTPDDAFTTEHELMVLGLRPGRVNAVEISIENEHGEMVEGVRLDASTEPLPDYFPPINVILSRPARMEPGITLVPLFRWTEESEIDREFGLLVALDPQGEVIWYYEAPHIVLDGVPTSSGTLVYQYTNSGLMAEIDMLGRTVTEWHTTGTPKDVSATSIPVDADTFHHEVLEMPSGNFLALSTEVRRLESYPTSETDPDAPWEPADVIGDVLIEFQRDGTKVREWKLFDLLDPTRIGYNSLNTNFYRDAYAEVLEEPGYDWTHANGIDYDADDDAVVISINKMSVVIKLDLESGELDWMLGTPEGWRRPWRDYLLEPHGELAWSWHHHAPKLTPLGTILLYDNGARRALPPTAFKVPPETYSRAVEYRVDEASGTVEQIWSYGWPDDEPFFSSFLSEADWLPETENILITNGALIRKPDGTPGGGGAGQGHNWVSIMEVTHTTPAEKVWEVVIDDPAVSWTVYRTERLPSLYF